MLEVQRFVFNPFAENTYLIWSEDGSCAIVDPGCMEKTEKDELISAIDKQGLNPVLLLNTHCHIDHVLGNAFVFEKYGLRPMIHPKEAPLLEASPQVAEMYGLPYDVSPRPIFLEADHIDLGNERLEIIDVPGHSPGHVAFYHRNTGTLFSGDVLFKQSIGRTDLPGGDMDTLLHSIEQKLLILPDETTVYSGHMEPTTIGEEKKMNPFLKDIYQG